jgi:cytidyltransferase-like protein
MKKIVITSGYFNPVHKGHIALFKEAKALGDFHIVIINNDEQVKLKGSVPFMDQEERLQIVSELKDVDLAVLSVDDDGSQCKTLDLLGQLLPNIAKSGCYELVFANGGDRGKDSIPENMTCEKRGISTVFGVGGDFKMQSSSTLIKNSVEAKKAKL